MTDEDRPTERTKSLDEVFCRSCGEVIKEEAEICPKCGVRVKEPSAYQLKNPGVAAAASFFGNVLK